MQNIFRYERKFIINNLSIPELENLLRFSSLKFKKNFIQRKVNSIYFDDYNSNSILENLDGNNLKTKFRLRWYGDKKLIKSPVLELKKKESYINSKELFQIKNFKKIKFSKKNINLLLNQLKKKFIFLLNKSAISSTHYNRLYFISSKKNVRATIDFNINYFDIKNYINLNKYSKSIILEIKYLNKDDEIVRKNLENISFRISKNSKYLNSLIEYPNRII
tara:strand:- start:281 stop:940 length:660 start_codon:yes stop_codon:yes gene_type:complete